MNDTPARLNAHSTLARTTEPPRSRKTLVSEVVNRLRLEIARGTLDPGRHLVETRLAADLEVSRGTIREALTQLASTGMVESTPGAGHRVRYFSERDVLEVGEVFSLLEGRAVTHMELPLKVDAEQQLRELAEAMRPLRLPEDLEQIMALDREFHHLLLLQQPQSKLRETWRSQEPLLAFMVVALLRRDVDHHGQAERHLALVDAAMTGDRSQLIDAIDDHYRQHHAER